MCGILLALISFTAHAQEDDDSIRFIHGLPETGEVDTLSRTMPDRPPRDLRIPVARNKIPAPLLKTLNKGDQYRGWENGTLYFQPNTRRYVLMIRSARAVRTFEFNENGKPVAYSEADSGTDNR